MVDLGWFIITNQLHLLVFIVIINIINPRIDNLNWRIVLIRLTCVHVCVRLSLELWLMWERPTHFKTFLDQWSWIVYERQLNIKQRHKSQGQYYSMVSASGFCPKFLLWLPHDDGMWPWSASWNKPCSPNLVLVVVFIMATRNQTPANLNSHL